MAQEWTEKIKVEGARLLDEVEQLLHEGNVKHIVIKHDDHTLMELPINLGVAVALLAPSLAAVAAIGALVTNCTVEVVRIAP